MPSQAWARASAAPTRPTQAPKDPSRPGRSTSPSTSYLNDPAPPSAPLLFPRTLPGQPPGLRPQGRKRKAASEPWSFFLVQKPHYTNLHCLQQRCRHQIKHKIRHKHSSISNGKVFKNYSAQQKEKVQSQSILILSSKPVSQAAF